jgi:uncharacterized damage-inducible protein DinB
MSQLESMLEEFTQEAKITRIMLDRVPAEQLAWKPHERSMSLGQLALHIATVPAGIAHITEQDFFDAAQNNFTPPAPENLDQVLAALKHSVARVEQLLTESSDDFAQATWHLMMGSTEMDSMPRVAVWRSLMLNHWYHHRGQLSVYLRLLGVPVPAIYGPSADEPFFF